VKEERKGKEREGNIGGGEVGWSCVVVKDLHANMFSRLVRLMWCGGGNGDADPSSWVGWTRSTDESGRLE
jgi:hypothetical protein